MVTNFIIEQSPDITLEQIEDTQQEPLKDDI